MSNGVSRQLFTTKSAQSAESKRTHCSNTKTNFQSIQSRGRVTRVRARLLHTMLHTMDAPPPLLPKNKPCLDRCLRSRYLPTQIPFSALPCAAYLSARDVKQIAEIFKRFSILPDSPHFDVDTNNATGSSPPQREHLNEFLAQTNDKEVSKSIQSCESFLFSEQRSNGGSPVQPSGKSGMSVGHSAGERPLKGTSPGDLAISKEWLIELLLAAIASNFNQDQMRQVSSHPEPNTSTISCSRGSAFDLAERLEGINSDRTTRLSPFAVTRMPPIDPPSMENSPPLGTTDTAKDVPASLAVYRMRRFQQKQAILAEFKRDLLAWVEPLLLVLDSDHNIGIKQRCEDQVEKLRFFHRLIRNRRPQRKDSLNFPSLLPAMSLTTLANGSVLPKANKHGREESRNRTSKQRHNTRVDGSGRRCGPEEIDEQPNLSQTIDRCDPGTFHGSRGRVRSGLEVKPLACLSPVDAAAMRGDAPSLHRMQSPAPYSPLLDLTSLSPSLSPSLGTSTLSNLSHKSSITLKPSVRRSEGGACLSKTPISRISKSIDSESNTGMKEMTKRSSSTSVEACLPCYGRDSFSFRTVEQFNRTKQEHKEQFTDSQGALLLIYYGEQPDGTRSQTFKNILTNPILWEQFLVQWDRKGDLSSTPSEGTNHSFNGTTWRRHHNHRQAVVSWRDFSNNLILPADCLPNITAPVITNSIAVQAKLRNDPQHGMLKHHNFRSDTTPGGGVRGEAAYKRVLRMRVEAGGDHKGRVSIHRGGFPADCQDQNDEDEEIEHEEDSRVDGMSWKHGQLRHRADRVPSHTSAADRGFNAIVNSSKSVINAAATESEILAQELKGLHSQSADHVLISLVNHRLVTSSKDGLVKLWDAEWGNFMGNLLNVGTSWVLHMQLLHKEQYLFVATSNAELTVLDFPSGSVLQKYRGCTTLATALRTVVQLDLNGTKRFGLKSGECGPHRFVYRSGMSPRAFGAQLMESWHVGSETKYNAFPIEGFVSPTAVFLDPATLLCFFGTYDGTVGGFDLSQHLKSSSILSCINLNEKIPILTKVRGHDTNTPVMGLCYSPSLQYVVSCARDGSVSHILVHSVGSIEGGSNAGRMFSSQSNVFSTQYHFGDVTSGFSTNRHIQFVAFCLPARLVATVHSDRRVLLWNMGRNTVDLVHRFSQEIYDIVSVAFTPKEHLIAMLTTNLVISLYDFKGLRPISTIQVANTEGCNIEDLTSLTMRCPVEDGDGCVAFFPGSKRRLVCAVRGPILFDRSMDGAPEELSAKDNGKGLLASLTLREEQVTQDSRDQESAKQLCVPALITASFPQSANMPEARKNITHDGPIVDILLRRVHPGPFVASSSNVECPPDADTTSDRFELHTFSSDWWRVWDPLTGDLLREVNLCKEIRKQLPMFRRLLVTVSGWSTYMCTRIIAGSRGGQIITLDASNGTINNVQNVLPPQRPCSPSKELLNRLHENQTTSHMSSKKSTGLTFSSKYKSAASHAVGGENKQIVSEEQIIDSGSLFNLDVTVVYHYGMHMLVCSSNRCVLRRYFSNDVAPSGEEQFISMNFHLPVTARTTITACCIVRDTHICFGTMDTRLFFYRMIDGSEAYAEERLRSNIGATEDNVDSNNRDTEIGAVIGLFFLNDTNQNLFVIVLDTGVVHVYSYLANRSLARFRLHRAHECRIRKVIYHNNNVQLLISGDSLGRVRVLDISAFKSSTIDFAASIKERCVFQAAPDEVSSLAYWTFPAAISSLKSQELPTQTRKESSALPQLSTGQYKTTATSIVSGRLGKTSDQADSEISHFSSPALTAGHTTCFSNVSMCKPTLGDVAEQEGLVVVGARDGNVRLFALQKEYERSRSHQRPSTRTAASFDFEPHAPQRLNLTASPFGSRAIAETTTAIAPGFAPTNAFPFRDPEATPSRRRQHLNVLSVGVFGLSKWDAMKAETFQRDLGPIRTVESATALGSSRCLRSASGVVPSPGHDEAFLDHLLLQAKRSMESGSYYNTSQTPQSPSPADDRATAPFQLSKPKKISEHVKGRNGVKPFKHSTADTPPRIGVVKLVKASFPTLQRAGQSQQKPRIFRRYVSQRDMNFLKSILPTKHATDTFLLSVIDEGSTAKASQMRYKAYRKPQLWYDTKANSLQCILRSGYGLKSKYRRNILVKMYPVPWLRKIEVIPSNCKIKDYNEDGSPCLIAGENAFSGRWSLSISCSDTNSNKNANEINDTTMSSDKALNTDIFIHSRERGSQESESQRLNVGEINSAKAINVLGGVSSGDVSSPSSIVQQKCLPRSAEEAPSLFITDLASNTLLKVPKVIKSYDSSPLPSMEFTTFSLATTLASSIRQKKGANIESEEGAAVPSTCEMQALNPISRLQDSADVAVQRGEGSPLSYLMCRSINSDALNEKTPQQQERRSSTRHTANRRCSSANKPVFISGETSTALDAFAGSVSLAGDAALHSNAPSLSPEDNRIPTRDKISENWNKSNLLEGKLQALISDLPPSAINQRYDQAMLAHLAHQLDRVQPSGHRTGSFMHRTKQVWQQRSIEDATQTMILQVTQRNLHTDRSSSKPFLPVFPTPGGKSTSTPNRKFKSQRKPKPNYQPQFELSCNLNHDTVEQDPGIGLNLAVLALPIDKKNACITINAKYRRSAFELSGLAKNDRQTDTDGASWVWAHQRLHDKMEIWRQRQVPASSERRAREHSTTHAMDGKVAKSPFSNMPHHLVQLPLLFSQQTLQPVEVSKPSTMLENSKESNDTF